MIFAQKYFLMKTAKFLICSNPISETGDFILHTHFPSFLVKVTPVMADDERLEPDDVVAEFVNSDGFTEHFLLEIFAEYEKTDPSKIKQLLKKMAVWYAAYLKWEEEMNSEEEEHFVDYCDEYPDLKVLYSELSGYWAVIYRGISEIFDSEEDMDKFVLNNLKLQLPEDGYVNEVSIDISDLMAQWN